MSMHHERLTEQDREELVAYIDGELEGEAAAPLEAKLGRSMSGRREVDVLRRTWELLDWLPRSVPAADFTSKTLSRVQTEEMRSEAFRATFANSFANVGRWLVIAIVLAASLAVGFFAIHLFVPDDTAGTIRILPLIERFEDYKAIPSFEFLDQLKRQSVFPDPAHAAPAPGGGPAGAAPIQPPPPRPGPGPGPGPGGARGGRRLPPPAGAGGGS